MQTKEEGGKAKDTRRGHFFSGGRRWDWVEGRDGVIRTEAEGDPELEPALVAPPAPEADEGSGEWSLEVDGITQGEVNEDPEAEAARTRIR